MSGVRTPLPMEAMLACFEQTFRLRVPFREDGLLGAELANEVRPLLHCLAEAAFADPGAARAEFYGLLSSLGQRAGALGVTPSAALALREALLAALSEAGMESPALFSDDLTMVLMEGYCSGRDERTSRSLRRGVLASQITLRLAPRCCCVFLNGPIEADALTEVLEEAARQCFRENSVSVLLDTTRLDSSPAEEVARAVLEFCLSCGQIGARVLVACSNPTWLTALGALRLSDSGALLYRDSSEAVPEVLRLAGHTLRPQQRGFRLFGGR